MSTVSLTDSNDYFFCRRLIQSSNTVIPNSNETLAEHVVKLADKLIPITDRVLMINLVVKGMGVKSASQLRKIEL